MKLSYAVFCLIVMLGLATVTARAPLYVSPCKLECNAKQLSKSNPCIQRAVSIGRNLAPEEVTQMMECLKPYHEAFDQCMKACPYGNKMVKNPNLRSSHRE